MEVTKTKYHGFSQNNANEKMGRMPFKQISKYREGLKGCVTFLLLSMLLELLPDNVNGNFSHNSSANFRPS